MTSRSNPVRVIASGVLARHGTLDELEAQDATVDRLVREAGWDQEGPGALGRLRDELGMILYSGGTSVQVADYFRALDAARREGVGRPLTAFAELARSLVAAVGRDSEGADAPSA